MKTTNIKLTTHSAIATFNRFRSAYRAYATEKEALNAVERDMKSHKAEWIASTEEFNNAPGEDAIAIFDTEDNLVAKFTKARNVVTVDKRAYITAVLKSAGADEATITTVTGLLATTSLLEEMGFSAALAKKQHAEEYKASSSEENKGPRTVKFS